MAAAAAGTYTDSEIPLCFHRAEGRASQCPGGRGTLCAVESLAAARDGRKAVLISAGAAAERCQPLSRRPAGARLHAASRPGSRALSLRCAVPFAGLYRPQPSGGAGRRSRV